MMLCVFGSGWTTPRPSIVVAVLDLLAVGQHLADADEHAARLGRIPHVPARDRALLDELASLPGRERSDHEHLAHETLLLDRAGGADRALAAESEEAL